MGYQILSCIAYPNKNYLRLKVSGFVGCEAWASAAAADDDAAGYMPNTQRFSMHKEGETINPNNSRQSNKPLTLEGVQADLMQRIMAALPRDKDNKNENNEDNKKGYMAFFMAHPGARLAHLDAKVQEAAKLLAEDRPSALSALEHILTKGDAHPFFKGAKYEK